MKYSFFSYLSRFYNVRGASRCFWCIFSIVYMCFLIWQPFWCMTVIFSHFHVVIKRINVLFYYLSQYYKVISANQEKELWQFFVLYLCFSVISDIYIIFSHFKKHTKRNEILFYNSSQNSKVISASQTCLRRFCIIYLYFHYLGSLT